MSLLLAHLLPLLAGSALYAALIERPRRLDDWLRVLGYGYLIGLALVAMLVAVLAPLPQSVWSTLWMILVPVALVMAIAAWWRPPADRFASANGPLTHPAEPAWSRWLLLALAAWLLVRTISIGTEVEARDLFAWDAWATWSVKAKVWYLSNAWLPFVDEATWLGDPDSRYLAARHYPSGLPFLEVWFVSANGSWHVPAFAAMWPLLWLAAIAIAIGQLRALSLPWWLAATATAVWASLPLINTHAALAGYADLPLTIVLGASGLALARYTIGHGWRHLLLAVALALLLPGLKLEGSLWLLLMLFAALVAAFPRKRWLLTGALAVILLWTLTLGLHVPLPALGWVEAGWGYLRAPGVGIDQVLTWRAVGPEIAQAMLMAPNWHLLWWLSLPLLLLSWRGWANRSALSWLCLGMLTITLGIFCFTDAAVWAQDLTAMNRVLMHVTLLWVCWLALLISDCLQARGSVEPVRQPLPRSGSSA